MEPITLLLTEGVQRRLTALFQQRQAVDDQLQIVLATAVEAMGYEGTISLNTQATPWTVTITPPEAAHVDGAEAAVKGAKDAYLC